MPCLPCEVLSYILAGEVGVVNNIHTSFQKASQLPSGILGVRLAPCAMS